MTQTQRTKLAIVHVFCDGKRVDGCADAPQQFFCERTYVHIFNRIGGMGAYTRPRMSRTQITPFCDRLAGIYYTYRDLIYPIWLAEAVTYGIQ